MGIIANYLYRGTTVPSLYFRVTNITLASKEWSALAWGYKDRDSSMGDNELSPAFTVQVKTPYIAGVDPYAALYAALHADPTISDPIDVLVDPPRATTPEPVTEESI